MQTRTQKRGFWPLFSYPYRFHHATEAVLRCNSCCFTMQNRLRCSVTQAPLHPKRIFDCVLNLYTFRANFVSLSFSAFYEHAHISPVRTEKIFGSEFLNLRGAIVKIIPRISMLVRPGWFPCRVMAGRDQCASSPAPHGRTICDGCHLR